MVRLNRIYTKSGDDGTTALGNGARVPKTHPRIEAFGTVDELGAVLGLAVAQAEDGPVRAMLRRVQNDLFDVGADLCVPPADGEQPGEALRVTAGQVARLEAEIDTLNADLAPLESFILSGGSPVGAHLHLARCVARRAERAALVLAQKEPVGETVIHYLNRLSDHLFVLARHVNQASDDEILWQPGGERPAGEG